MTTNGSPTCSAPRGCGGPGARQHLCADNGYDYPTTRAAGAARGYIVHIPHRGAPPAPRRSPRKRARRWVVEACPSWLNRFRKLLVRFEKKVANYDGLLAFGCARSFAGVALGFWDRL